MYKTYYDFLVGKILWDKVIHPNIITGEGRMKLRGADKVKKGLAKKNRRKRKISKKSRKRNQKGG